MQSSPNQKKILFILGMHRSGTSAMAGAIAHSGISGGGEMMPPAFDNERGFFENIEATRLNEAMLHLLGLRWDMPFNCRQDWQQTPQLAPSKLAIRNFLARALEGQQIIFIKDPRLSFLLPVWHQILAELNVEPLHLLMLRPPEEVYLSLQKRNDIGRDTAQSLWLDYNLQAERNTRGHKRMFVSYDDLLDAPFEVLQSVFDNFGLPGAEQAQDVASTAVKGFISKKLRHHRAAKTTGDDAGFAGFSAFYKILEQLSKTPDAKEFYPQLDTIWEQYQQNLRFFNPAVQKPLFASVQVGDGKSFGQRPPMRNYIEKGVQRLAFKLENLPEHLKYVRIFPCNGLALIRLLSVQAEGRKGKITDLEITDKKALVEHGMEFLVERDSYFGATLNATERPSRILLEIEYLSLGDQAVKNLGEFSKRIQAWFYQHLQEAETRAAELARQEAQLSEDIGKSEKKLAETQLQLSHLETERSQMNTEMSKQSFLINELHKTLSELQAQLTAEKSRFISLAIELAVRNHELASANARITQKKEELATEKSNAAYLSTELAIRNHELAFAKAQLAEKDETLTAEKRQTTLLAYQAETARANAAEQAAQLKALSSAIHELEARLARKQKEAETMSTDLAARSAELGAAQGALQKMQQHSDASAQELQQKDDQIWKLYGQYQQAESDYQQALNTLDELRTSLTFKLGLVLTWPFRAAYGLFSNQPINTTRLWLFLQLVLAGLRKPLQLLGNINAGNFRILAKALRNEPPKTIAANLQKKLTNPAHTTPSETESETETVPAPLPPFVAEGKKNTPQPVTSNGQAARSALRPKVLFTSPFLPDFDTSSGGKRATRMLGLLAESCDVYAFTLGEKPARHIAKLESLGVRVFKENDFEVVRQMLPDVDAIIFSFFYMWFDCEVFRNFYPKAKTIIDSVDVHWVRHERSLGMWAELTEKIVAQKKVLEIEVYRQADLVWAVTEEDRQAILAEVPEADVRIVSNVHQPVVTRYEDPGTHRLLFIGGFAHYPNIIAVKRLVEHIFPKIKARFKGAELAIAGSKAPPEVQAYGDLPGVSFLGFVEDSDIPALYAGSFLALAPLQTGAGIKGKICEAIAFRTPVLTNGIGNEGIGLVNGKSGLIAEADEDIVDLAVQALRREFDFEKMTELAQNKLARLVGPEVVKKNMLSSIQPPLVSICIVTWNRLGLLKRCIESIEGNTFYPNYKILVHSNGCTDGTQDYLRAAAAINPRIVPILSETNDVFVIPNNQMMHRYPESDVILLNNDTYVTPGWLTALHEAAYSDPSIGISGSKILYPDGRLQEFGSELYGDGTGRNIGKGDDPSKAEYRQPKYVGYVSGCSFYVKRQTIERIGVFDEAFHPCYCEDSDYCYTAWEHGIRTVVTPNSVIFHDEGGTSGTDTSTGFKAYQTINFKKFLAKHAKNLDSISSEIGRLNEGEEVAPAKKILQNFASKI